MGCMVAYECLPGNMYCHNPRSVPQDTMPAPSRELTKPKTGTFQARFVKGGPSVPIRVVLVADDDNPEGWRMQATVDGKPLNHAYTEQEIEEIGMMWVVGGRTKEQGGGADRLVINILLAEEISEQEYERLLELRRTMPAWHPCHRPYEPVDLSKLPPLGRRK